MARVRHLGITLIELLVALTIFSVIGVLSYRALTQASLSEQRIAADLGRWRGIARTFRLMDNDFVQLTKDFTPSSARSEASAATASALRHLPQTSEIQILVLDQGVPRRIAYRRLADKIEWERWQGREASGESEREQLLGEVRELRWRFLHQNQWLDRWSPNDPFALPDAVEASIETASEGTLVRRYALH